jgi:DNA-binding MarR family transcriptional regulator
MAARLSIDRYIVDALMPDLVGHDRQPSAFLVYLLLWCRSRASGARRTTMSLQQIALETGLSKSAVQHALRRLKRRGLVTSHQKAPTSAPEYVLHAPWSKR